MIRLTGFLHVERAHRDELVAAVRAAGAAVDALHLEIAPTEAPAHRAGQVMVLGAFADVDSCEQARAALADVFARADHVELVRYEQGPVLLQEPDISGIQRTLLLHVDPNADPAEVAEFEYQLASMGRYIDTIRNSSLSLVDEVWGCTGQRWTHVWEQEFRTLDGLTGPYMQHAHHWAVVDTWFDPQAPNHIVDTALVHAMCALDRSFLVDA